MVPPLVSFLATHPMVKPSHLASVVAVTGGAAPFGPALIEKFKEKCAPNDVHFTEGRIPYKIYFPNSGRIWVTDQNEKFSAFFRQNSGKF